MEFHDFRITLREAILSVTIASVLFMIGFFISTFIEDCENRHNIEYRQAVRISNSNEFILGMKTDLGNAFVEGDFHAEDTVTFPRLNGKWMYIKSDYQSYNMHTRTIVVSNGKHTSTRVVTYWSWDTYKIERIHSKKVRFCGTVFDYDKFDYDELIGSRDVLKNGFNRRIVFHCYPVDFKASVYTVLSNNTISDGTVLNQNVSIDELYNNKVESSYILLFWILWTLMSVGLIFYFVYQENDWIEDKIVEKKKWI